MVILVNSKYFSYIGSQIVINSFIKICVIYVPHFYASKEIGDIVMNKITICKTREIIEDFAKEIERKKTKGPKPAKTVIDFRNERKDGIERDIYLIPIELLRYRKDNGRISSDVMNYEKNCGLLNEKSKEAQVIIRIFLEAKDKEKTEELTRSIKHDGQRDPAIITADGFLINGNRRKMVMEVLLKDSKYRSDIKFTHMKVVILPGKDDEGGPPTLLEIEQIENRYQLQSEAKAEYSNFDRALSMRRKIEYGMSLEQQLMDDPIYGGLEKKEFNKAIKKFTEDYLKPLDCIDRYLSHLGREGLYSTVSTSIGDPEGRWQAFYDYYNSVYQKLSEKKKRIKLGIVEDEVGLIEDVTYKIIRKRELPGLGKVHQVIRDLPKYLSDHDSKNELLKLGDLELELPKEESFDENGKEFDERIKDKIWGKKHASEIINQIKKAKHIFEYKKELETPIKLLEDALKLLNHQNMDPSVVKITDVPKALKLAGLIKVRANEIENEFYHYKKGLSN